MSNQNAADELVLFLQKTMNSVGKAKVVIAVSGGIDSAVSCTLLCRALGVESVFPVLLPYGDQSTEDSIVLLDWLQIPESIRRSINIKPVVEELTKVIGLNSEMLKHTQILKRVQDDSFHSSVQHDENGTLVKIRLGNLMARSRMILLYDLARELDALVCGTENKSEKYLGYFTRFGDGASDIEPIQQLYKTQVRELAVELGVPAQILEKAPSAGLWQGQSDEAEFGFSYEDADRVLAVVVDQNPELLAQLVISESEVNHLSREVTARLPEPIDLEIIGKVLRRVKNQWFKQVVPYTIDGSQR